jgi:drug/metabolite transporter (DMT)-like permease
MRGVAALLGAACGFASVSVLAKVAYEAGSGPSSLLGSRVAVAAALLAAVAAPRFKLVRSRQLAIGTAGGAAFAGAGICEFEALSRAAVAPVVLLVFLAPIWVGLASWLLWRTAPGRTRSGLVALVLAGTGLLVGNPGGPRVDGGAVALALVASFLAAAFFLSVSELAPDLGAAATCGLLGLGATALMLALTREAALAELETPRRTILALAIGGLTAASLLALCAGLGRTQAFTGSAIAGVEPAFAALLTWIALGERLSSLQLAGAALIVVGVALLAADRSGPRTDRTTPTRIPPLVKRQGGSRWSSR